jgi:hypothetical protein
VLFGLHRRASGSVLAPALTHLTWSLLMLNRLPPLFRDTPQIKPIGSCHPLRHQPPGLRNSNDEAGLRSPPTVPDYALCPGWADCSPGSFLAAARSCRRRMIRGPACRTDTDTTGRASRAENNPRLPSRARRKVEQAGWTNVTLLVSLDPARARSTRSSSATIRRLSWERDALRRPDDLPGPWSGSA